MTQRTLISTAYGHPVTVLTGWDRSLQCYFMVIALDDNRDCPIYSNLNDDNPTHRASLAYFSRKANENGVTLPPALLARLELDKTANLGNARSIFSADGTENVG